MNINENILNWYNNCNLKFEQKLSILHLRLEYNKKDSKIYKIQQMHLEFERYTIQYRHYIMLTIL